MDTTPRVVLVGRVSRGERQQDPESQLGPLDAAAARHGWRVVERIPFKLSAWDERAAAEVRRRAFAPIVEGRADVLAVWSLDRITRQGIRGALDLLDELENHLGARFYSLQEPFLSTATQSPELRQLLLAIFAWMARAESDRKSERVRAKYQRKVQLAEQIGTAARWGRGRVPTLLERTTVHRLRAGGASLRAIAAACSLPKSTVARICAAPAGQ